MRNSQAASTRWYLPVQFLNPQDEREIGEVRIPYNLLSIQKLASWCMVRISRLLFCVVNDRKNETYYFAVRHPYEEISKFLSRIIRVAIISSVRVASVCYLPAAWNPIAFASSSATARKTKRENVSTALSHFKRTRSCVYDGRWENSQFRMLDTLHAQVLHSSCNPHCNKYRTFLASLEPYTIAPLIWWRKSESST